jgi:hypothetical protein
MNRSRIILFSVALLFGGCFGKPKYKEAIFNGDSKEKIEQQLRQFGSFEEAKIAWSARTFDDKTTHNLKIQLLNGSVLEDDSTEYEIGKRAMQLVVDAIENEADYDNFVVFFIKRQKEGNVTTGSDRPYEYQLSDLK